MDEHGAFFFSPSVTVIYFNLCFFIFYYRLAVFLSNIPESASLELSKC